MKLKTNRTASFLVVTGVYILAAAVGIVTYRALELDWRLALLIADVAATVLTFLFSVIFRNASVYDPYWSVQPMVILIALAVGQPMNGVRWGLLAAVCLWGIRLTANWAYTFHDFTYEDWRYRMLREKTGVFYPVINFVGIHMVPTLVVYLATLPAAAAFREPVEGNVWFWLGLCISFGAAVLQGSADIQMHSFRKLRTGGFIRNGLWKHSRHPNYLGEICMWWGIGLASLAVMPGKWFYLAGAVANTVLFLAVSIPMADNRQSAKPGFAQYKAQTRMLLPIPRLHK